MPDSCRLSPPVIAVCGHPATVSNHIEHPEDALPAPGESRGYDIARPRAQERFTDRRRKRYGVRVGMHLSPADELVLGRLTGLVLDANERAEPGAAVARCCVVDDDRASDEPLELSNPQLVHGQVVERCVPLVTGSRAAGSARVAKTLRKVDAVRATSRLELAYEFVVFGGSEGYTVRGRCRMRRLAAN